MTTYIQAMKAAFASKCGPKFAAAQSYTGSELRKICEAWFISGHEHGFASQVVPDAVIDQILELIEASIANENGSRLFKFYPPIRDARREEIKSILSSAKGSEA